MRQRLVRLDLVREYVPIFLAGFLGFRIRWRHTIFSLSDASATVTDIVIVPCTFVGRH